MGDGLISHERILRVMQRRPEDFAPYGTVDRDSEAVDYRGDCSCGCVHFARLDPEDARGADWGVCTNPASHRAGLLTFEHQGCLRGEWPEEGV